MIEGERERGVEDEKKVRKNERSLLLILVRIIYHPL
jgi:hypothetical protein